MATATTGIWNHAAAQASSLAAPRTAATSGSSGSSDSSSSDSATISANDFLTLLVTEMQNQDPTATQDPNEYINQLVQVNSLEQLININQTLTGALDPIESSSGSGSQSRSAATADAQNVGSANSVVANRTHAAVTGQTGGSQLGAIVNALQPSASSSSSPFQAAPGNLGVPTTNAAAMRVAKSLGGR